MKILTIADLSFFAFPNQLALPIDIEQQHFQMVMKQTLLGLPTEPLLKAHPKINNWVNEVRNLFPELFNLGPTELLVNTQFQAPLNTLFGTVYVQVSTNAIFQPRKSVLLVEWAIRHKNAGWYDKVKLWTASEYLSVKPEKLTLVILALSPTHPATLKEFKWSRKQHEETSNWLVRLLSEQPKASQEKRSLIQHKQHKTSLSSDVLSLKLEEVEEVEI